MYYNNKGKVDCKKNLPCYFYGLLLTTTMSGMIANAVR